MSIGPDEFRDALRLFPSGVTLVTLRAQGRVHGLTVSAFASISPAPPLVGVFIDDQHGAHALLESPGACFAVNILAEDQRRLAEVFAWSPDDERFAWGAWGSAATGAPVLTDACAWLDCTLHSRHAAGGHTLYVGLVAASATPRAGSPPLLYWNRGYRRLSGEAG